MMKLVFINICSIILISSLAFGQSAKNKGLFEEAKKGYWENEIQKGIEEFEKKSEPKKPKYRMNFEGLDLPKASSEFKQQWHNEPISQGNTGTCWCFASTSLLESEIARIHKRNVKLSEIYTVYWQYVEKARRFVKERGASLFAEGSQTNATTAMMKKYGAVPLSSYNGMKEGQMFHNHSKMYSEMNNYLLKMKEQNFWDEDAIISNIKSIMNYYLGEPPTSFTYEGKQYNPTTFLKEVVALKLDDYVDMLSILSQPYNEKAIYDVPDNWWLSKDYYNISLDEFMEALKSAAKKGFTFTLSGDVSEAGYDSWAEVAMVPTFDIPSEYIDEHARQFRFSNGTTTDDHGIHAVGYKEHNGKMWFLIKDSGAGSRNGANKGYYFYHEDYIKLKMMSFMVHKDAVEQFLKRFIQTSQN